MKISFLAADQSDARAAQAACQKLYGHYDIEEADYTVALGGDGFLLECLHRVLPHNRPVFGMRRGSVGFLLNEYKPEDLPGRLAKSQSVILHPLVMTARDRNGSTDAYAFNEASLLRETRQAAKLRISVDGVERMQELICDGALVSTPAGSTAYNLSAHGPILPLTGHVLALTPISAFRPRRWRGAVLPESAVITFDILEADKRPVSAVADFTEIRDVLQVTVRQDVKVAVSLLFDPDVSLEERIIREQFLEEPR